MAYRPLPPYAIDPNLGGAADEEGDPLLQEFLAALAEQPATEEVTTPRQLSTGERIYLAVKAARDPRFRERTVEPMIQERRTLPQRRAAASEEARRQRVKELGAAYASKQLGTLRGAQAAAQPSLTESKRIAAEASQARAQKAVARGGKIRVLEEAVKDAAGNVVGKANAPYVEDVDEDGSPILRRIQMVSEGPEGEVRNYGTPKATSPAVLTDETGKQKLVDRFSGKAIDTGLNRPPSPGIQQKAAQAISTAAGFDAFEKAYTDYQATQLGADPSMGSRLLAQGRGWVGEKFPKVGEVVDAPTANFLTARRAAINRYIKDVTGAQFSIKELERYEAQLPGPGAPKETAIPKIRALLSQSLEQLRAFIRQNGGLAAMTSPAMKRRLAEETDFADFTPGPNTQAWLDAGSGETAAPRSAQPGLPAGIPAGSIRAGRSRSTGKSLWRAPDGKLYPED